MAQFIAGLCMQEGHGGIVRRQRARLGHGSLCPHHVLPGAQDAGLVEPGPGAAAHAGWRA
ncbi:hypothetical protein ACFS32_08270 [Novosphingobium pokkalii]|uniref:hypothetical protein n=1 Tax=Novosphingobium pokkalii TaxID=1770194 RepID=UPI003632FD9A